MKKSKLRPITKIKLRNWNKKSDTKNLLYAVAVILLIAWAIGFFGYQSGGIIHVLIVIVFVAVLLRVNQGRRAF